MINCSVNLRLPVSAQKVCWIIFAYFFIQIFIVFQCFLGFASTGEHQIGQKVQNKPFMFMEVFPYGDLAVSPLADGINSFLNGVIEFIDTTLSFYEKSRRSSDQKGSNADNDSQAHLIIIISVLLCVWVIIHSKHDEKHDP